MLLAEMTSPEIDALPRDIHKEDGGHRFLASPQSDADALAAQVESRPGGTTTPEFGPRAGAG